MRTMFRKCGLWAALTAVLLLTAALGIGCIVPVDGSSASKGFPADLGPAPAGYGYVTLNIGGDSAGRAAFVPTTPLTASDFEHFTLKFNAATGAGAGTTTTVQVALAEFTEAWPVFTLPTITIPGGAYASVEVTAYQHTGASSSHAGGTGPGTAGTDPIASGTLTTNFTIGTSPANLATIPLHAYADGVETGSFTFSATNNLTATKGTFTTGTQSLTLRRIGSLPGAASPPTYNNTALVYTAGTPGTWDLAIQSIPSGFYYADFSITVAPASNYLGGGTKVLRNVLQVYAAQTTEITGISFEDGHFGLEIDPSTLNGDADGTITWTADDADNTTATISFANSGGSPNPATGGFHNDPLYLSNTDDLELTILTPSLTGAQVIWSVGTKEILASIPGEIELGGTPTGQTLTIKKEGASDLVTGTNLITLFVRIGTTTYSFTDPIVVIVP